MASVRKEAAALDAMKQKIKEMVHMNKMMRFVRINHDRLFFTKKIIKMSRETSKVCGLLLNRNYFIFFYLFSCLVFIVLETNDLRAFLVKLYLRSLNSLVPATCFLFSGTVLDNLLSVLVS